MLMRLPIILSIFLLSILCTGNTKVTFAAPTALPKILKDVEQRYSQQPTLKADFTQTDFVASTQITKKSSGTIYFKRPDKVRWETLVPDRNLLVGDGKKFWFYTPPFDESEKGQVIERKANEVQSRLAQAFLSGRLSMAKEMKIKPLGTNHFELTPKKRSAGTINQVEIQINPDTLRIVQMVLLHQGGNKTTIDLQGIEFGVPLGDEFFQFTPPPNTDRIQP